MAISKAPGEAPVEASGAGTGFDPGRRSFLRGLAGMIGAAATATLATGCGVFGEKPQPGCDKPNQQNVRIDNIHSIEHGLVRGEKQILTTFNLVGIEEAFKLCKNGGWPVFFLVIEYTDTNGQPRTKHFGGGETEDEGQTFLRDGEYNMFGIVPNDRNPSAAVKVRIVMKPNHWGDDKNRPLLTSADEILPV